MKKKIAVLFGGNSSEHEISLKSGRFIFETLDKQKYDLIPILLNKKGEWLYPNSPITTFPGKIGLTSSDLEFEFFKDFNNKNRNFPLFLEPDVCFLGFHGGEGENGTIQGFLSTLRIPYTGSGITASSIAMDKFISNQIFEKNNFYVSPYFEIKKLEYIHDKEKILESINSYPYFVKPTNGGSSVCTGIVNNKIELDKILINLFEIDSRALLQKPIKGVEVSCGVIEKKINNIFTPIPLYPTEIIPNGEFFDFESKYNLGGSKEITPARISDNMMKMVRILAVKAHSVLGCKGYSRTDFIIENEIPYILETNTLPGMTETSLIPQQVVHSGDTMSLVFDLLIENSLQ
jgi:D-alanine-D-alanine ligase